MVQTKTKLSPIVVTRAYTAYIWRDRRKSQTVRHWPYESLIGRRKRSYSGHDSLT
jgi:hypothetical protein